MLQSFIMRHKLQKCNILVMYAPTTAGAMAVDHKAKEVKVCTPAARCSMLWRSNTCLDWHFAAVVSPIADTPSPTSMHSSLSEFVDIVPRSSTPARTAACSCTRRPPTLKWEKGFSKCIEDCQHHNVSLFDHVPLFGI